MLSLEIPLLITLISIVLTIGVQYGIYQSFKNKTLLELEKFEKRMERLEQKTTDADVKIQKILDSIDGLKSTAQDNWQRIFTKLDSYDDGIKNFYKDLPRMIREHNQ